MHDTLVRTLGGGSTDVDQVGGKAAALSRLIELGHMVPAGAVATVAAFDATIRHLDLEDLLRTFSNSLAHGQPDEVVARKIRETLGSGTMPTEVVEALEATVGQWFDQATNGVIVRSSATVEDSASHSFAGIFESTPITNRVDLIPTMLSIWSSVFSPRAMSYAVIAGVTAAPEMALVIQRFVEADRAGVMFSTYRAPDGTDKALVEYVEGAGEKLVKGEVTPDRLWLDGSTSAEAVESGLAAEHIAELVRLSTVLEEQFGGPQDVEWCTDGNDLFVVQTRPITAMPHTRAVSFDGGTALLTGLGASPGVASGKAHIAHNIEQAMATKPGDVLVCPMTNPDMVVAMRTSAAIVTDVGGMICHAAIVSRELGVPCVVGTRSATVTLAEGQTVTVDGFGGRVLDGEVHIEVNEVPDLQAADIWHAWLERGPHEGVVPRVSSVELLRGVPQAVGAVALVVDYDLRSDARGLWFDIARRADELPARLDEYLGEVGRARDDHSVLLVGFGAVPHQALLAAVSRHNDPDITMSERHTLGAVSIVQDLAESASARSALPSASEAIERMTDPSKVFGHQPEMRPGPMPAVAQRERWWNLLPEYGRYHREFGTAADDGVHMWVDVRPEIVISPLLKSLVQPGFEMVPRILGFSGVPPLNAKWIKGRFHFRADTFAMAWGHIVRSTWDGDFMADLMRRVRQSYDALGEVLQLFPCDDAGMRSLEPDQIRALVTSWWPRWVEFFALSQFIQAQGDDVMYPFVEETVSANLADLADEGGWPQPTDFVRPTTAVRSAEFMESITTVRNALDAAGLDETDSALLGIESGAQPALAEAVDRHIAGWHWMRDRDLLFEPWDTPQQVIETALRTEPFAATPYDEHRRSNRFAVGIHADLAEASGRRAEFELAARYLQDLNLEREDHHVLWLEYSYPLRRLVVEVERRLVAAGGLEPGDIFFLQAPELISAVDDLPNPVSTEVIERVRNRIRGYRLETKLEAIDPSLVAPEDDYL